MYVPSSGRSTSKTVADLFRASELTVLSSFLGVITVSLASFKAYSLFNASSA